LPERYILFVGTIQPRKNLVRLIEAFSFVGQLQLIIAGKLGWMYEEILEAPMKFGVEKEVKFIGRVAEPDLAAVYKGAELFVWPSLMEGFGLPVLEAMSMGVPVITSNRGALPEVVGEAALQIDPENVRELAEAMRLVLKNTDLQEGLREKGYGQAAKFSWKKAAKKTLKVLTSWD
jgi:glycosyltransferase involved in cell wall biosynthesis